MVDAGLSEIVVARLPGDRANARVRLVFFAGLAIAIVSVTGGFAFALGRLAMTAYRLLSQLESARIGIVALVLAVAVIGFWTWRLFKTLPGTLVELARQVATGAAAIPTPQPELWLLRDRARGRFARGFPAGSRSHSFREFRTSTGQSRATAKWAVRKPGRGALPRSASAASGRAATGQSLHAASPSASTRAKRRKGRPGQTNARRTGAGSVHGAAESGSPTAATPTPHAP